MNDFKIKYDVNDELLIKLIELDKTVYEECDVGNFDLCKSFLRVNPDIYTVLMCGDNPVGYISFYPLKSEVYSDFISGKLKDFELTSNDILKFNDGKSFNYLFSSIVIDKKFQGTGALSFLLSGFKSKLMKLNITNGNLLCDCVSEKGEIIAKNYFNSRFVTNSNGGKIFEGDIESFMRYSSESVTKKAGCYLINLETKKVAVVYRDYLNDWSFPKGHLEEGETLKECAIRETAEEIKRVAEIVAEVEPIVEIYTTPKGESCECYMYLAVDKGKSDNTSTDTHPTYWISIDEVEDKLSYESLKYNWKIIRAKIQEKFGI